LLQQAINGNIPASVASVKAPSFLCAVPLAANELISNSFLPEPLPLLDHSPEFLVWRALSRLVDSGLAQLGSGFASLDRLHRN